MHIYFQHFLRLLFVNIQSFRIVSVGFCLVFQDRCTFLQKRASHSYKFDTAFIYRLGHNFAQNASGICTHCAAYGRHLHLCCRRTECGHGHPSRCPKGHPGHGACRGCRTSHPGLCSSFPVQRRFPFQGYIFKLRRLKIINGCILIQYFLLFL